MQRMHGGRRITAARAYGMHERGGSTGTNAPITGVAPGSLWQPKKAATLLGQSGMVGVGKYTFDTHNGPLKWLSAETAQLN